MGGISVWDALSLQPSTLPFFPPLFLVSPLFGPAPPTKPTPPHSDITIAAADAPKRAAALKFMSANTVLVWFCSTYFFFHSFLSTQQKVEGMNRRGWRDGGGGAYWR